MKRSSSHFFKYGILHLDTLAEKINQSQKTRSAIEDALKKNPYDPGLREIEDALIKTELELQHQAQKRNLNYLPFKA